MILNESFLREKLLSSNHNNIIYIVILNILAVEVSYSNGSSI